MSQVLTTWLYEPTAPRARPFKRRAVRGLEQHVRRFLVQMSPAAWVGLDSLIIGLVVWTVPAVLACWTPAFGGLSDGWLVTTALFLGMAVAGLVFGLYERKTLLARSYILVRSALTFVLGTILAGAIVSVFPPAVSSHFVVLAVALAYLFLATPIRLLAHEVITASPVRLLCVGAGPSIRKLVVLLQRSQQRHHEIVGHVRYPQPRARLETDAPGHCAGSPAELESDLQFAKACPCLGELSGIVDLLAQQSVDEVVVGSELVSHALVGRAVTACLERRYRVTDQATYVEKLIGQVPVENIATEWLLLADVQNRGNQEVVSRAVDIGVAALGLLLSLPLWPLIALIVRLDSRGPALYRQIRTGQHGRGFTLYKFRTMSADAERNGARWAEPNDVRVTRVGRFLRRSRLDELPQLVNILRGDMALVGPRPERPEFNRYLERLLPHYRVRYLVKPGLTGWAQIHHGYGSNVIDAQRKLCYDLYYVKHRSLELNAAILIRTFGAFALGAR
jgi:exopolysaccharide biosynthesis polyprenyl glycosylphosphotransferase